MFQVGQHVLCIRSFGPSDSEVTRPVKGGVYTVRGIYAEGSKEGLLLEEIRNPPLLCRAPVRGMVFEEVLFVTSHFRPLSSDRLSIFRQHLAPLSTDKVEA